MSTLNLARYDIFLAKLEKVNFAEIAQLLKKQGWKRHQISRAIPMYCKYLFLVFQNPDQVLNPTKQIDEVLHAHLALGTQFEKDCKRLFGRVLHHEPCFGNDATHQQYSPAFQQTQNLFKQLFGVDLTDDPANCFTRLMATGL